MLTKAIIYKKNINLEKSDYTENCYEVKIPLLTPASSLNDMYIATAYTLTQPGIVPAYEINDVVWVEFEGNDVGEPVILGKVFTNSKTELNSNKSSISCNALNVASKLTIPASTEINYEESNGAAIKYNSIKEIINKLNTLVTAITPINNWFSKTTNGVQNIYSNQEVEIGLWVGGKKLYRIANEVTMSSQNTETSIIQLQNASDVTFINFSIIDSNGNVIGQQNYSNINSTEKWVNVKWNKSTKYLTYYNVGYATGCKIRYAVEYIKE